MEDYLILENGDSKTGTAPSCRKLVKVLEIQKLKISVSSVSGKKDETEDEK